ncbi:MAG: lipopolysaccharide heptosyltransferase I [Candidatus Polarisedimenticolaceae bacterium]|nr:lipopolysaccharide heptosyltransferase I [Candidatus Polarisedimenticolaceae bacterium]
MRVLLVKTSSLGDLIHTLPALTDAAAAIPGIRFDWVAEEAFSEIPRWHPAVDRIIPIALRRWRKAIWRAFTSGEIGEFRQTLQEREYDLIIDAQGLMKSALVAKMARGLRCGYDTDSIRDPRAATFYQQQLAVSRDLHAIDRVRQLFALALGYDLPDTADDAGIRQHFKTAENRSPYIVLLHGTTWPSKHWPEHNWSQLTQLAAADGYQLRLPWGNAAEQSRAERIAKSCDSASAMPPLSLSEVAQQIATANGVIGIDTGLSHLASALGVPAVTLYGATQPELTGTRGSRQKNLQVNATCAPCMKRHCDQLNEAGEPSCYSTLPPEQVWSEISQIMQGNAR